MCKTILALCVFATLSLSQAVDSCATLIDINNRYGHTVYDSDTGKYWIWDLSMFANRTKSEQGALINSLNNIKYGGISNWQYGEFLYLWLNAGGTSGPRDGEGTYAPGLVIFNPSFSDADKKVWYGRTYYDVPGPPRLVGIDSDGKFFGPSDPPYGYESTQDPYTSAWVSGDGPAPVPEPASVLLISIGFGGIAGWRFMRRRNSSLAMPR